MNSGLDIPIPTTRHEQMLLEREACAWRDVARTTIRPAVAWGLTLFFLATISAVPLLQQFVELRAYISDQRTHRLPRVYDLPGAIARLPGHFHRAEGPWWKRITAANTIFLRELTACERDLEENSVFAQVLRPPTQWVMTKYLGQGNEQVYVGRDSWLFYRPDIDYVTSPHFLDPGFLRRRAVITDSGARRQPDPRTAILDFHRQLQSRGIQLVLLPTPIKSMVHPEHFAAVPASPAFMHNPAYAKFRHDLEHAGVKVFDLETLMADIRSTSRQDLYLASDTHWRPEVMQVVARELARFLQNTTDLPKSPAQPLRMERAQITQPGDIARMLKVPATKPLHAPETVTLRQILTDTGEFWRPVRAADVLLLGDSFANIFSLPGLNWGESAGLAEQLSFELERPIDTILRNDQGSHATRQMLSDELGRGRDRLAGKRVVIWQFAMRELVSGDWKSIPMKLGEPETNKWLALSGHESIVVSGLINDISAIPKPGKVPYRHHLATVHLVDLQSEKEIPGSHREAVVYVWSMRDNQWTDAARWRPGHRVTLRLVPWIQMETTLGTLNRSELDDDALLLAEPHWGEAP